MIDILTHEEKEAKRVFLEVEKNMEKAFSDEIFSYLPKCSFKNKREVPKYILINTEHILKSGRK